MRGATDVANEGTTYTFAYEGGTVTVTGATEPEVENREDFNYGDHIGSMLILYTKSNSLTFTASPGSNAPVQAYVSLDGERDPVQLIDNSYTWSGLTANDGVNRDIEFVFGNNNQPGPTGDTTANITVGAGAGTYKMTRRNPETGEYFEEDVAYDDRVDFRINGSQWIPGSPTISYDSDGNNDTVVFTFESLWIDRYYEDIVINGHTYTLADYNINYDDKSWWLAHNNATQLVSFSITNVPKSESYNIVVKHGENNGERFIGNFLWTADPGQAWKVMKDGEGRLIRDENGNYVYELDENGDRIPNDDDYIGHSSINLVAVSYDLDNHTYTCDLDTDLCTDESHNENEGAISCVISEDELCAKNIMPYVSFESDESVEYDDGALVVPSDAHVTMEIIPDYGYQIMNVNMSDLTVSENGVGRFTFKVPAGAAYFKADVVEMEDTVSTNTDLVASGEISLGENQTTLDHGTAKLNVSDVELEEGDITEFEDAAGDYEIKNYLEISLYNITCKGAEVCTGTDEDAWVDQIKDLNEPATITLQLEEGVDGNEIVIVHQKHDGTYEVIPTTYDPETHTITFTTTSFSNYAIASRTVESPETGAFTGDSGSSETNRVLAAITTAVIVAGAAIIAATKFLNRREKK